MSDGPPEALGSTLQQARARLLSRTGVQALAFVAAGTFAYTAARILQRGPTTSEAGFREFDTAMLWIGLAILALLAMAVAAWQPLPTLAPATWASTLATYIRGHWIEVTLFTLILGFGIFMRVFRFGDTLPPSDGLCCEEHINGGVAYLALLGDRPVLFPLVRWASAGGFLIFGENTLGLRFFFPVMSIATLVLFYFLLRQFVRVQAALFGLALYAAAWWPAMRGRQTAEGTIYAVLLALLLVRALKTRNPVLFLMAGVVAGLISYEYEAFKVVPMVAVGFAAAGAARQILMPLPVRLASIRERAASLLREAWRPALIFLMAAGIVLVPMIVGTSEGKDLYLTSVHRQENSRGGDRLADNWPEQLKWAGQLFLPFAPTDYPVSAPRDMPDTHHLDPLAASLALAGFALAIVFITRGFRLLFVAWITVSLVVGALLLQTFAPWSFFGVVPVLLALAAIFVDDVRTFVTRRFSTWGVRALAGLLVVGAAFSFWWNADTLFNDVANSPDFLRAYGREKGLIYASCDYLQGRGDENHTLAFSGVLTVSGFATPRETEADQQRAWGDYIWVCHDLEGTALAAPEEAWPLLDPPEGKATLAITDPFRKVEEIVAELNRAYPDLGEPDKDSVGPGERYRLVAWELESGAELARRGLQADYLRGGETVASRVDQVANLEWDKVGLPLGPPLTVRWRGLVYLDQGAALSLQALGNDSVEVRLDGRVTYSTLGDASLVEAIDLLEGWHTLEITLEKEQEGGGIGLAWVDAAGVREPVAERELFPLAQLDGWLHQRSLGTATNPRQFLTQRFDFAPHLASTLVLKSEAPISEPIVTEERYTGVWHIERPGDYTLAARFRAGTVTLFVDGIEVASGASFRQQLTVLRSNLTLAAGPHTVELVQQIESDAFWSGMQLTASLTSNESEPIEMRVTPY